jgi:hypothetical protein
VSVNLFKDKRQNRQSPKRNRESKILDFKIPLNKGFKIASGISSGISSGHFFGAFYRRLLFEVIIHKIRDNFE